MTSVKPQVEAEHQASSNFFGRERMRRFFPIFLLVALAVAFSLTSSRFLQFNNLMIVAQQAVVLLVAALGMTFVVIAGSIDLSVGAIVAIAALVAAKTSGSIGVLAILPACAIGVVCGLINGLIVAKGKVRSFIVTLGAMVVYRGVVLYFTRGAPVSIENEPFLEAYSGRTAGIPNSVLIALVLIGVAAFMLNLTVFGREVRAIGGGERIAHLSGIRVDREDLDLRAVGPALWDGRTSSGRTRHGCDSATWRRT
jgi:ribose transport system permease protein